MLAVALRGVHQSKEREKQESMVKRGESGKKGISVFRSGSEAYISRAPCNRPTDDRPMGFPLGHPISNPSLDSIFFQIFFFFLKLSLLLLPPMRAELIGAGHT